MRPLILKCPSCNGDLAVAKLHCHSCEITVEGDFSIPALLRLNRAQLDFVEVFLKNRGIIREVERELGVSYPTVRARLDEVLGAIGFNLTPTPQDGHNQREVSDNSAMRNRRAILEQLSAGKISAEDAMRALGTIKLRNREKSEREEPDDG
ncbi:MAG TPA: DUF2089 domain-containing protein [Candidatus Binataceae bacterium]|nr:DUF2089 domain-containing protein [Candidatus Binataceae bacterium]